MMAPEMMAVTSLLMNKKKPPADWLKSENSLQIQQDFTTSGQVRTSGLTIGMPLTIMKSHLGIIQRVPTRALAKW
ncbi:hypothetical protein ASF61_22275 [Duganella sp. Leaf126]|nr:hypothetical protein ASF61_22275 [Duganella sp. Leaf126]